MAINDNGGYDRIKEKLAQFWEGTEEDLKLVGQNAAESIVRFTLAGVGEDDRPFAPYSQAYRDLIAKAGGKPQGTVNLRGLFYKKGQKRVKYRSQARQQQYREGRQVGKQTTRPARGVTDPLSEMSLDLIRIETTPDRLRIIYTPREKGYMVYHQQGSGPLPKRTWFTLKRAGVVAGMMKTLKIAFAGRVARFNQPS